MPSGLKYADAVRLLGGTTPAGRMWNNLLGGALSVATAGGSDAALSFFDAKAEMVRLGRVVTDKIHEGVRGLGRYDRSERLQAAHTVLVVLAFFDAFDEVVASEPAELTRDDQIRLAAGTPAGSWLATLVHSTIPVPSPAQSYASFVSSLEVYYRDLAGRLSSFLQGLAVWDPAFAPVIDGLPALALRRYEESQLRLAVDVPEFGLWLDRTATQAMGRSLETLESSLLRATSGRDPSRHRAALALAYRAELNRPALSGASGEVEMPTLGRAYVDPPFRARAAGPDAHPADESWWEVPRRDDLPTFLAGCLTTPQAATAPMLLLGQPGAGKSALTRVLAARLPAADFLAVRVVLREVPAEAEIQNQIETGLRSTIGETVAWADLSRSADGAMPVILLDGFDELLQATGIHQSDYLHRVAAFQEREAVQGRPVAVIVTSRIAVADRARLPVGTLAVRLDSFEERHVGQWLATWNEGRSSSLPVSAVWRFPDLASQPLLLLMLALYDASGHSLRGDFDMAELYERLLTEFADREVRRLHVGRPEADFPALIENELNRLSIVAFGMFNRLKQWLSEAELDADLAGLGLAPAHAGSTESFKSPLTAGQEVVGRFFFIQRGQAMQDGWKLRTYEFLHATFGEYLVARLVVRVVAASAASAAAAASMPFPGTVRPDDSQLRSLLGMAPLTARGTVLPFIESMLSPTVRPWLMDVLRIAMTDPQPPALAYRPVPKRIDHWMATYSLNLMLLTLTCGEPVRATEVFRHAKDPASWLQGAAHQWRAAIPSAMWDGVTGSFDVVRSWTGGTRDLALEPHPDAPPEDPGMTWSANLGPDSDGQFFVDGISFTSMRLLSDFSEDVVRHAVQPLIDRDPASLLIFESYGPGDSASVGHSLLDLLLASYLPEEDDEALRRAYARAAGTGFDSAVLQALRRDGHRLPAADVVDVVTDVVARGGLSAREAATGLECLAAANAGALPEATLSSLLTTVFQPAAAADDRDRLRAYVALSELGRGVALPAGFFDRLEVRAALAADRILRLRLENLPADRPADEAGVAR